MEHTSGFQSFTKHAMMRQKHAYMTHRAVSDKFGGEGPLRPWCQPWVRGGRNDRGRVPCVDPSSI